MTFCLEPQLEPESSKRRFWVKKRIEQDYQTWSKQSIPKSMAWYKVKMQFRSKGVQKKSVLMMGLPHLECWEPGLPQRIHFARSCSRIWRRRNVLFEA